MPGVFVRRSASGTVSIVDHGRLIGWLHASYGADWKAVLLPGTELGKFKEEDAIRAVVRAYRVQHKEEVAEYVSA